APSPPKMPISMPCAASRMREVLNGVGGSSSLIVFAAGTSFAIRTSSHGSIAKPEIGGEFLTPDGRSSAPRTPAEVRDTPAGVNVGHLGRVRRRRRVGER